MWEVLTGVCHEMLFCKLLLFAQWQHHRVMHPRHNNRKEGCANPIKKRNSFKVLVIGTVRNRSQVK